MENRDRDKLSRKDSSTSVGDVNRDVTSRRGEDENVNADFGQKIGQSERHEPKSRRGEDVGSSGIDDESEEIGSSSEPSGGNGRP